MESECCALVGTDCRPTSLRRRARRPQLKRDPLGSTHGALTPTKDGWRRRLNAASLAQTKYLWLLLVLGVFDWVAYTTHSSAALVKWLLGFSYPLYMTIFTVEATILLVTVARSPFPVPGRSFFTSIAVLEGILTYGFLVRFWWGRARRWPRKS